VARIHVKAVDAKDTRYVIPGIYASWHELFITSATLVNAKPPRIIAPRWLLYILACAQELIALLTGGKPELTRQVIGLISEGEGDNTVPPDEIQKLLKLDPLFEARKLDDMLNDTIQWMQKHGMLT
jgi:hypothetical protein